MSPKPIQVNAFGIALLTACFFYISEIFAGNLIPKGAVSLLFIGIIRLIQIAVFIRIVGFNALGLEKERLFPGIIKGLIWSFAFGLLVIVMTEGFWLWSGKNPMTFLRSELPENGVGQVLFFCVGGCIAPIAEEIFFRGILYGFFRRWGIFAAMLLSTAIFFNGGFLRRCSSVRRYFLSHTITPGFRNVSAAFCLQSRMNPKAV